MHLHAPIRFRHALVGLLLLLAGGSLRGQAPLGQPLLVDTFGGPTTAVPVDLLDVATPAFPCLTAGTSSSGPSTIPGCNLESPDPAGAGLLRLTPVAEGTASAIISTRDFPTLRGLRIRFTQYQWGGYSLGGSEGGGDGIAFFLAVSPPIPSRLGPQGGALGYASDGDAPGLENGWLGIGFDAFGFYGSDFFGGASCPAVEGWGGTSDQITVRGPEHSGYCRISSTADHGGMPGGVSLRGSDRAASRRRIEIVIDPDAGTYRVGIDPTGGDTFEEATSGPLPSSFADPSLGGTVLEGLPPRLTFGFSASTGNATDVHEIGDVEVRTLSGSVPTLGLTQTTTLAGSPSPGDTFEYVLTPRVDGTTPVEYPIRISNTLPAGVTLISQSNASEGWDCTYSELSAYTCSYSGADYPVAGGTVLPSLRVPVRIAPDVEIGTTLVNDPYVISVDAAAAYHATSTLVVAEPIFVDTTALPAGTVGVAYAATLTASGGNGGATWTLDGGALPAGLTLSPGGQIAGTPAAAGDAAFVVRVTDSLGAVGTAPLSIAVAGAAPVVIDTAALPAGTVGTAYDAALSASGGSGAITWSLDSGSLPGGLSLAANGGVTGTPTAAGTFAFSVRATDAAGASATRALAIDVAPPPLTILTPGLPPGPGGTFALPGGTVDVAYSATLTATGGTGAITWSIAGGALPAGLSLSPTGAVTGTPTIAGTASFTARATDAAGATATVPLSIAVAPAPLTIPTPGLPPGPGGTFALPGGTVGVSYAAALTATGGTGAITWSIAGGALPAGLSLSPTGAVTGTPTIAGTASFTARATDAAGATATVPLSIAVAPGAAPLTIVTTSLPNGRVGQPYAAALTATGGGTGAITWSLSSGALPAGLSLSPGGSIGGTPTSAGTASFTVQATRDGSSATRALTIAVTAGPLRVATTSVPSGHVGVAYSATLDATGGAAPYRWTLVGTLPPGLSLTAGGTIAGTPTTTAIRGSSFMVRVTDAAGASAMQRLTIAVSNLRITTTSVRPLTAGAYGTYLDSISATGGIPDVLFSVVAGSLPPGLTLRNVPQACYCAYLYGTATAPGTFTFTIQATDAGGWTDSRTYTLVVNPPQLYVSPVNFVTVPSGRPFSRQLFAYSSVRAALTWSIAPGSSLPAGVTLAPDGALSGTLPAGTFTFRALVTDEVGTTATTTVTIWAYPTGPIGG